MNGPSRFQGEQLVYIFVARISPCYRGRNGSLSSIGWKGRFLCGEMQERKSEMKLDRKKSKDG